MTDYRAIAYETIRQLQNGYGYVFMNTPQNENRDFASKSSLSSLYDAVGERRLGCLPHKSDPRALMLRHFIRRAVKVPKATNFWTRRAKFPVRSFGNTTYGNCTFAKQAYMFMRFERLERRRTIDITDGEVVEKYLALTTRLYGGGDTGAYEDDALDASRRPDQCLRDTGKHPLLIDAYAAVNAADQDAVREAMYLAAGKGLAVTFNLPAAYSDTANTKGDKLWDIPAGQALTGEWMPGSWGGHSMWTFDYNADGPLIDMTWDEPPVQCTWRAAAAYMDGCRVVIDQRDAWRKALKIDALLSAVNKVSRQKVLSEAQKAVA